MTDLLIRKIDPKLKRELEKSARANSRSLSEEAKTLLGNALRGPERQMKMGTWMASIVPPEVRGDDLIFEVPGEMSEPPDFE